MAAQQQSQEVNHQIVRIPFLETPHLRGTSTAFDNRFVNGFFEPIRNKIKNKIDFFFLKRPGLSQNVRPSGGAGTGRGVYQWALNGAIYSVVGTKIYKGSTDLGVTLTTSTGRCGIVETRPGAATPYLCINDGAKLYCIKQDNTVTTVTVNFPANTRDLQYMDQYIFVLDTNGNLWNSNADDPTTWSNTSITSQMMPGMGVGLARQQNMMIVFTDRHLQMFYDAANAAGSPLTNAESYMHNIGCDANDTIARSEDTIYWVGNGFTGGYTVWKLSGPSQLEPVGVAPIDRIISLEGTNLSNARAVTIRHAGHIFYVLTLSGANRTFVYDTDLDYWFEWTDTTGSNSWPIVQATEYQNGTLVQHTTNGWLYNFTDTVFQDDSVNFTVTARTPRLDFDTMRRKFVNRMDVVADRQSSSETISVTYSDDDYQTFSTARTYDISLVRNFGRAWSNFRRRSWQIQYTGNQAYRIYGIELDISIED